MKILASTSNIFIRDYNKYFILISKNEIKKVDKFSLKLISTIVTSYSITSYSIFESTLFIGTKNDGIKSIDIETLSRVPEFEIS